MKKHLPTIVCILGIIYGFLASLILESGANSVMHQLYSAQYSIIAAMFLCTLLIIYAISKKQGD